MGQMTSRLARQHQENQEKIIWNSFKKGDSQAFEQLYQRYFAILTRYGFRLTANRQLLEDAIQDVFVELWRRKEHLADVENVKFYLLCALRNQIIRNIRHDRFETAEDIDDFLDFLVSLSSEQHTIQTETETSQRERIQHAITQLSGRQREAIHLRFYHGLSLDEMAQLMGLTKQSVSNLLFKSYAVLRLGLRFISTLYVLLFPI
ncbi:RNA polymerase sigma-70 factor [Nibrella saemangeumensis]|uniref:RNA polymerase sigma-70 factor n=1 Tax=Nibrella saemangeumensis TaxID=1084526 RepID=A0ABP8NMG4_9BACT